jgi:hypothetical protein
MNPKFASKLKQLWKKYETIKPNQLGFIFDVLVKYRGAKDILHIQERSLGHSPSHHLQAGLSQLDGY